MLQVVDLANYNSHKGLCLALTIGNFDGCHLGHQELVLMAKRHAAALNIQTAAVTFSPRPEAFFRGTERETLLFTAAQKTRSLSEMGLDWQLVQRFDAGFAALSAEIFYEDYLRKQLQMAALVVGDNFHFGHRRQGDVTFLQESSRRDGFRLSVGEAVQFAGQRISSTRIRDTLQLDGDVTAAALMLGRPYLIEGVIERGDQLGRQIGAPTANLGRVGQLLPKYGVYAGYVWLSDGPDDSAHPTIMSRSSNVWPAIFNIGVRPTLGQEKPPVRVEAHLLQGQFGPDALYGLRAGYYLAHRLRGEQAFAGMEALRLQIAADKMQAIKILGL